MRSRETITGVTETQLNDYSPDAFDAVRQPDGTYNLVPLMWTNQEEFFEYAYGCGQEPDDYRDYEAEGAADAAEYERDERTPGPGAR